MPLKCRGWCGTGECGILSLNIARCSLEISMSHTTYLSNASSPPRHNQNIPFVKTVNKRVLSKNRCQFIFPMKRIC